MRNLFSMPLAKVAALLTVILGSWALSSCLTEPKFSFTPRIDFTGIRAFKTTTKDAAGNDQPADSVIISIHFEDGDGDLGLAQAQILADTAKKERRNYLVDTFVKKGNTWELKKDNFGKILDLSGYFFPLKKSTDKPSPIEGTLDFLTVFFVLPGLNPGLIRDSVRFEIKIRDLKNNESNPITTTPVYVIR